MRCLRLTACLLAAPLSAQLTISEVLVDPVGPNAGNQIVEIMNISGSPFTPTGWQICVPFVYAPLPAIQIPDRAVVRLHIAASGTDTVTDFFFPFIPPLTTASEFLLYKSGCFTCSADIIDYVSWGGGAGRRFQAVGRGLWPAGATVTLPTVEGHSISFGGIPNTDESWYRDSSPTLGQLNDFAFPTSLGTPCATSAGLPLMSFPTPGVDGNLDFKVRIASAPSMAGVIYLIGLPSAPIPYFGCTIDVNAIFILTGAADAAGVADLTFPLSVPGLSLTGVGLVFQAAPVDLAAPNGLYGLSTAEQIIIG